MSNGRWFVKSFEFLIVRLRLCFFMVRFRMVLFLLVTRSICFACILAILDFYSRLLQNQEPYIEVIL